MSTLTGAAEDSVARSALHKRAKRRILDRDTLAPADVEALLRSVYALTPANRRRKLDEEGTQILEKGRMRGRLKAALATRTRLDTFADALLGAR